ncbi:MAG TPA: glycosyltransferase family 2 protein [Candidatus Obscuribacterales bacterium]
MKLSIVATLYRSEKHLREFYERITRVAQGITDDFELILVNDGSPDGSLSIARELHEKDARVVVLDLSRNFGHHKAALTGVSYALGETVFLIDSDLEEPPELLGRFWRELHSDPELDVVFGVQQVRRGEGFNRLAGSWFYKVFNALSDHKIVENEVIARLMTRRYVDSLIRFREADPVLAGLCSLAGFNRKAIPMLKGQRRETSYDLGRKVSMVVRSVTSFSAKPLIMIFYLGATISLASFLYVLTLVIQKLVLGCTIEGWITIAASIWLLGGLILFSLGVIGIYVAMIFNQVKNRPLTIVRQQWRRPVDFQPNRQPAEHPIASTDPANPGAASINYSEETAHK